MGQPGQAAERRGLEIWQPVNKSGPEDGSVGLGSIDHKSLESEILIHQIGLQHASIAWAPPQLYHVVI